MKSSVKALLAGALVAGLGTGLATTASAQTPPVHDTEKVQKPFRIQIGGYFPTDSKVKDAVGNSFPSFGISYDLGKSKSEMPITYGVYFDAFDKSRTQDGLKGEIRDYMLGVQGRYFFTPATSSVRFYGGAGLGFSFLHGKTESNVVTDTETGATQTVSDSENKTTIGGKLFAGAEMNMGLFGELKYEFPGKVSGLNASGWGADLGFRF